MNERIAFIGLGIMGAPMAANLLRAGYAVAVCNRTAAKAAPLEAQGARLARSPADAARDADVAFTMLSDDAAVEGAAFGADGIAQTLRPGGIFIDCSTIAPQTAKELARRFEERGIAALDAPVSGGERGAREATLAIMVGGAAEAFERARPIFAGLGANVMRVGESGAGQIVKACNQLVVVVTIEAVAEALALANVLGVDPALARDALMGGFAQSRILEEHGKRMVEANFRPGGKLAVHLKDYAIVKSAAAAAGIELPAALLVFERLAQMAREGRGELDHSALYLLVNESAGASAGNERAE